MWGGGWVVNGKVSSGPRGAVRCSAPWALGYGFEWCGGGVSRVYEMPVERAVGVGAEVMVGVWSPVGYEHPPPHHSHSQPIAHGAKQRMANPNPDRSHAITPYKSVPLPLTSRTPPSPA